MDELIEALDGEIAPEAITRARSSRAEPLDSGLMAEWIARFFAQARG